MDTDQKIQELVQESSKVLDAHRQFYKVKFKDNSMDFVFQWVLGGISNGGGAIGEMFYTAAQIEDFNPDSWAVEWPKIAERLEERAKNALGNGHNISAREFYMSASYYYRASLTSLLPQNPEFMRFNHKSLECFTNAGALFDPQIEMIRVPFENTTLPGCFIKANSTGKKQKTILVIGGGETFFVDLYFHIGPAAIKRGYNFITVDLPGQGVLPSEGHVFRPDTETPIGAIIDYILARPDVDADRFAAYGISAGGYFVPRASIYDKRIKACISNCAITNLGKYLSDMAMENKTADANGIKMSPFNIRMMQLVAWRFGLEINNIPGIIAKTQNYTCDASQLKCPVLNICSCGEYLNPTVKNMNDEYKKAFTNPKSQMVVTSFEDGASTHCLGENTGLLAAILFDWLDELFD